jgi:hypothetical protein
VGSLKNPIGFPNTTKMEGSTIASNQPRRPSNPMSIPLLHHDTTTTGEFAGGENTEIPFSAFNDIGNFNNNVDLHSLAAINPTVWHDSSMLFQDTMAPEACLFGGPYSNNHVVIDTLSNPVSSVDGGFGTNDGISTPISAFPSSSSPKSSSFGSLSLAISPNGNNFAPSTSHSIERPFHAAGSGFIPRSRLRASNPPRHQRVEGKTIKKRGKSGRLRMLEAMNLLEQLKNVLESDFQFAIPINELQEAVSEELVRETRTLRLDVDSLQGGNDSGYHSAVTSYYTGDAVSTSATSGFSFKSGRDGSMAILSSDKSLSKQDVLDTTMDTETPQVLGALQPVIPLYHCTFSSNGKICDFTARSKCDWVRHEESNKHWPRKRYMCLLCIDHLDDEEGAPICPFCFLQVSATGNNKTHYLQCEGARRGKHIFAGSRNDHFKAHLGKHGMTSISREASTWTFATEGDWPRQCGFCPHRFTSWEERTIHVAAHFQDGLDIASWKNPVQPPKIPKDYRPGINHQRREEDDDDGDDDPGHGKGQGPRAPIGIALRESASSQTISSANDPDSWSQWIGNNLTTAVIAKNNFPSASSLNYPIFEHLASRTPPAPPTASSTRLATSLGTLPTHSEVTESDEIDSHIEELDLQRSHSGGDTPTTSEASLNAEHIFVLDQDHEGETGATPNKNTLLIGLEFPGK